MNDPEVLSALRQWLRYAEDDLQAGETLLDQGGVPRTSCFHAQQAVEKTLKAIFVFLQVDFPFIHDLDRLRDRLPQGWEVKEKFPDLSQLSEWAVYARYPGDVIEPTRRDAEEALEQARGLYKTVLEELARRGYAPSSGEEARGGPDTQDRENG